MNDNDKKDLLENRVGETESEIVGAGAPRAVGLFDSIKPIAQEFDKEVRPAEMGDFDGRVAEFKPIVRGLVGVLDGAGIRLLRIASGGALGADEMLRIEAVARMSDETKTVVVACGSRILARHVESSEVLDWIGLSAALMEWASGLAMAIRELKSLRENQKVES